MGERALVYRGPAACEGCAEAMAALLRSCSRHFDVSYVGPGEHLELTAAALRSASLYAQPGGGNSVRKAYRQMKRSAAAIRDHTWSGGRYLGICMGAYLAGTWRGFGFLPDTDQFITSPGADVTTDADTIVRVDWRGRRRHMFFQDGTVFPLGSLTPDVTVLARYASNGAAAAVVAPFGQGRIGVCGPHPEAPPEWYEAHGLTNPDGIREDLGHDLIETLMG